MAKENIYQAINHFFREKSGVAAVYVFGSLVKNEPDQSHDIDIAVLYLHERVPDYFQIVNDRESLSEQLNKEVDLVLLNGASPILKRQVLEKGKLILDQQPKIRHYFHMHAVSEYYDFRRIRRPLEEKLIKEKILRG